MFPTSSLHTDFARQLQQDRRSDRPAPRAAAGPGRVRVLLAALRTRRRPVAPAADAGCPATA
jgi:hypothetical protein